MRDPADFDTLDMFAEDEAAGAVFSPCRRYRYRLWRVWDSGKPYLMFLMLNPSTVDVFNNDPTVARCQRWAYEWDFGGVYVCNLFGFCSPYPDDMMQCEDPIGVENDAHILDVSARAGMVLCAWGNHGAYLSRSFHVTSMLQQQSINLYSLALTKNGEPGHPLYLRGDVSPMPFKTFGARNVLASIQN